MSTKGESLNYKFTYWLIKTAIFLKLYKLDFYTETVELEPDQGLMVSIVCEPRWIWQKRHPDMVQ